MIFKVKTSVIKSTCLALAIGTVSLSGAMAQSAATAKTEPVTEVLNSSEQSDQPVVVELSPEALAVKARIAQLPRANKSQRKRADEIESWYANRDYAPAWIVDGKASAKAEQTIYKLLTAYEDGLIPSEYDASRLFSLSVEGDVDQLAEFEISLTATTVVYAQHLFAGRVIPSAINRELVIYPKAISAESVMDRLQSAEDVSDELTSMSPDTPRYDRLRKHLLALRIIEAGGGYTPVPDGEVLKPGQTDDRLSALRRRLIQSNDLPQGAHKGNVYNGNLEKAVRYFQWRMGLEVDGVVGPGTLKQLNTSVEDRIKQVELNLERRRWMQNDFGKRYIFVNLADQVLKLVDNEKTVHAEIVQVGLPFHRTPVFSDEMSYLEINPFWNVPYSIATKEYLPKLKQNPNALVSSNIRVLRNGKPVSPTSVAWNSYSRSNFPVRLRQDPGPKNALGRVKFMFPNKYNIYIHDTPAKSKFTRASRYFSHGCVRLNRPFKFAEKLLSYQGMGVDKINAIRKSGKRTVVTLEEKVPVHITYLTAWVNKDGSVHYRKDVYGRDKILRKALEKAT